MRIGAHLTITKGLPQAAVYAHALGANTLAFFPRNPRGGRARHISPAEIAAWEEKRAELDIWQLVAHLPYTVNCASHDEKVRDFAVMVLTDDLARADRAGWEYLNVHPGNDGGAGRDGGVRRIVATLAEAARRYEPQRAMLLLETMAGQSKEVGGHPEELKAILDGLGRPPWLGICLDSCHLFAAGYDLRTPDGVAAMLDEFDRFVGLERVKALHLNDSKMELGSRRDRHALLGDGHLGEAGIRAIVNNEFLRTLPIIIETPVKEYDDYAGEIAKVKSWVN